MSTEELMASLLREFKRYCRSILYSATLICVMILVIGFSWPKQFHSSTSIYADKKNIIRPLMEGVAENTDILNQNDAKELIFSRKIMQKVLEAGGWPVHQLTPVQQEIVIENVKKRTTISLPGPNILRIEYRDDNAERAYKVASTYAQLFLDQTVDNKKNESEQAYDFIDNQVTAYHEKLQQAEDKLKQFRTANVDSRPGGESQAFTRIADLRKELEITTLQLREAQVRRDSLTQQLQSEANSSEQAATVSLYQNKIQELQQQIDLLRLTFHDTYPDIVRLKQQITDMQKTIEDAKRNPSRRHEQNGYKTLNDSAYYQSLRSALAQSNTDIALNTTRINELKAMIDTSKDRVASMSESQAAESELVRDYDVNKELYQNLLRKRENARVSMNMDIEGRGLTFKIQEPANMPLLPSGLRFVHFLVLAPLIALGLPLGLLFAFVYLDPRLRSTTAVGRYLELPILSTVPPAMQVAHLRWLPNKWLMLLCVTLIVATYLFLIAAKVANISLLSIGA
jgi:hypothetical protein